MLCFGGAVAQAERGPPRRRTHAPRPALFAYMCPDLVVSPSPQSDGVDSATANTAAVVDRTNTSVCRWITMDFMARRDEIRGHGIKIRKLSSALYASKVS